MTNYSTEFHTLKHSDVKRYINRSNLPLIMFIPEEIIELPRHQSTMLKDDPKILDSTGDFKFD